MSDSIWKKELSLRRKPKGEAPAVPPEAEPGVAAEQEAAQQPAPAELPTPKGDYGWLTTSFDPNDLPDEMPAIVAPPVSGPPPVHVPLAESDAAPREPVVAPAAVAAPPEAKSTPFWKKELSLGRGSKQPKAAKAPKAAKEPKAPKEPREKKPPLWKRELKLERKPKVAKQPNAPKRPKQPREQKAKSAKSDIVGLKIGASQVAAARVSNTGGAPHLLQIARVPLADGVVVGGELRDIEALAQALKELFAKHKLPKKGVRLGIANNRIGVRTFEISGIDDSMQLANAIKFRAQETLPIPLEEAVLDWQLLSEWTDEETGQTVRRVLLVVAYRELVERYVLACKKAGISVAGIDLEAFAMLRALAEPRATDAVSATGAQVVVNVGHDRSTFAVSDGRVCEFTRVLGWGGQNVSVAIARALDMTPSEATPIKHVLSLVAQSEPPEGVAPEALGAAREAVMRELQSFARELVASLRFYQNQPGSLGIGQLVLTGGSAHLPGFADELHRLIGVPVFVGDPLNRVAIPKKFREPEYAIGSLTVAIGLGIED
ncbi:MAG: type IV pilus assembly protein PilM [Gaiellaceae bacterium]